MGLDITAYGRVGPEYTGNDEDSIMTIRVYNYEAFAALAEPLVIGKRYRLGGTTLKFRAGSYSGYNQWRAQLSDVAGHGDPRGLWKRFDAGETVEGPFVELIHFSDCEGTIGPVVSAKLARDFDEHRDKARAYAERTGEAWWLDLYELWSQAFHIAAGDGCVYFH